MVKLPVAADPSTDADKAGSNDKNEDTVAASGKDRLAPIIGVFAILAFLAFIVVLLTRLKAPDLEWERMVYLFGGVEAIAFAAAGYFFGKEVHRAQAEDAKKDAANAKKDAKAAQDAKAVAENEKAKLATSKSIVEQGFSDLQAVIETKRTRGGVRHLLVPEREEDAEPSDADTGTSYVRPNLDAIRRGRVVVDQASDWDELAELARSIATRANIPPAGRV
jgi:hypothetical protein